MTEETIDLHRKAVAKPNAKPAAFGTVLSEPMNDRALRGHMHSDVRRIFNNFLTTTSVAENRIKIGVNSRRGQPAPRAQAQNSGRGQNRNDQRKGKLAWENGEYLHFTAYKENNDTMELAAFISRQLKVHKNDIKYSGTKDRRAATTQRMSVFRKTPQDLAFISRSFHNNTRLGDYKYENQHLTLNDAEGNAFTITLRDCHFGNDHQLEEKYRLLLAEGVLNKAVKILKERGFINYFGLQRFGSFKVGSHEVGMMLLRGEYERAVRALLDYSLEALHGNDSVGRDDIARAKAIRRFWNGQGSAALRDIPRRFQAEYNIVQHLSHKGQNRDYVGAIMSIASKLRDFYLHAYQSLVWNSAASERWAKYGTKVVEGDLVIIDTQAIKESKQDDVDESGEVVVHASGGDAAVTAEDMFERARTLTAEEAESGRYSIFDIVLPLPGWDINYPAHEVGQFYKNFMASERGGGLDWKNMSRSNRAFSLPGKYRAFMSQFKSDVSFEVKTYFDEIEQLVETDKNRLDRTKREAHEANTANFRNGPHDRRSQGSNGRGRYQNNEPAAHVSRFAANQDVRVELGDVPEPTRHILKADPKDVEGPQVRWEDKTDNPEVTKSPSSNKLATDLPVSDQQIQGKYKNSAQLNAWANLPSQLEADDKAAAEARELEKQEKKAAAADAAEIVQPAIQDTWVKTSSDGLERRKVAKVVVVLEETGGVEGSHEPKTDPVVSVTGISSQTTPMDVDVKAEGAPSQPAAMETDKKAPIPGTRKSPKTGLMEFAPATPPFSAAVPVEQLASKRSADEITSATGLIVTKEEEEVEPEGESAKLAVILRFSLGSSQYATIALRELMKEAGVQNYKPDFSRGR